MLEIESVGGLASSISLTPVRKVESMVEDLRRLEVVKELIDECGAV